MRLDLVVTLDSGGTIELHGTDLTPLGLAEAVRLVAAVVDRWAEQSILIPEPHTYRPA